MAQLHHYWKDDGAEFQVDGKVVASTAKVPSTELCGISLLVNLASHGPTSQHPRLIPYEIIATNVSESVQIDYFRDSMERERFLLLDLEISGLCSRVLELTEGLGRKGRNTTLVKLDYSKIQEDWREDRYLYDEVRSDLRAIMGGLEHWDETAPLFPEARAAIETLEREGRREVVVLWADYTRAEAAWIEYDYETSKMYLHGTLDEAAGVPESLFLLHMATLRVILLPALLCRREAAEA